MIILTIAIIVTSSWLSFKFGYKVGVNVILEAVEPLLLKDEDEKKLKEIMLWYDTVCRRYDTVCRRYDIKVTADGILEDLEKTRR